MKKLSSFLFLIILISSTNGIAQNRIGNIAFEKLVHNYGIIKEADGKAVYKFAFTNKGKMPAIITNVVASCGCTSPDWTKAPIPPNQKGYVNVAYDPYLRPGNFKKDITVTFADKTVAVLQIMGDVIPKAGKAEDRFQFHMESLWLRSNKVPFAKIKKQRKDNDKLPIYNSSNKNMTITFKNVPKHIKIEVEPKVIKPKKTGVIKVFYDAKQKKAKGFVKDMIKVLVNGKEVSRNTLYVSATIVD